MRIISLLPSLTEIVCALGRQADLVGVTHECDYPPGVSRLPHLTRSRIPASASSAEIDAAVSAQGGSLYELDAELLASLKPDLILTQSQCDVCAVNEGAVRGCAANLPGNPRVESVNPTDWPGVEAMFAQVGEWLGDRRGGKALADAITADAAEIAEARGNEPIATVALLEWLDPPFVAGHWIPDLIAMAGGHDVLGRSGEPSRRATWAELVAADPEVILLSPCGFSLERAGAELPGLLARPEWSSLRAVRQGRVALIDGNQFFSRPGPRLRASLGIAAAAINPARFASLAPSRGWRMLSLP